MEQAGGGAPFALEGSAALPWPVPGCGCVTCLAEAGASGGDAAAAPTGLRVAGGLRLTAAAPGQGLTVLTGDAPGALALTAGATLEVGGVRVLGLPHPAGDGEAPGAAGAPSAVAVVGAGGRTVLWAAAPGPLGEAALAALAGARLDAAVLDLRGPDGRPDPQALARDVARLRRADALQPAASLVAVGFSHQIAGLARLRAQLAWWGVQAGAAGHVLAQPDRAGGGERSGQAGGPGRRVLVLGPAASGKSEVAESLLAAEPDVVYASPFPAPGADDPDWARRVHRHRARRPPWWATVEDADVPALLATAGAPVLLDSLGSWVTQALTRAGAFTTGAQNGGTGPAPWQPAYLEDVDTLVDAWRAGRRRVVAVGEETGWGVIPATASGRVFRDALGTLTRRLAEQSERVLLVVAGRTLDLDATTLQEML